MLTTNLFKKTFYTGGLFYYCWLLGYLITKRGAQVNLIHCAPLNLYLKYFRRPILTIPNIGRNFTIEIRFVGYHQDTSTICL
jgi:hypothetical protein